MAQIAANARNICVYGIYPQLIPCVLKRDGGNVGNYSVLFPFLPQFRLRDRIYKRGDK